MSEPYATPEELATYMQATFDDAETATAEMLLGFMATLIRNEYTDIDARTPPIDPELPQLVSLELVSRKMLEVSVRGASSTTESMDDITQTVQYGPKPFAGLELDAWAISLLSANSSSGPQAFGIRMSSYGANSS